MKQKKICFLLGGEKLSGAEKRIIITALQLAKNKKYKVSLITKSSLKDAFFISDISSQMNSKLTWRTRELSSNSNKYIRGICNLILLNLYNLYQLPWFNGNVHVVLFNRLLLLTLFPVRVFGGSKFIFEITSPDVAVSLATSKLLKYKFLYDDLVCVSDSVAKKLDVDDKSNVRIRRQPFAYFNENKERLEKENLVVFAHRLISRKNPVLAVDVFSVLAKEFKEWRFCICGDGELKNNVKNSLSKLNLSNLEYLGYVNDMDDLVGRSKIFVSLIEPDNYPSQSLFNAMANSNALIVSDKGESKEKFIANNGYAVKLELNDIVCHIAKLLTQEDLLVKGEKSKKIFESKYSPELYFDETSDFYY